MLRIGVRGSKLALAYADRVCKELSCDTKIEVICERSYEDMDLKYRHIINRISAKIETHFLIDSDPSLIHYGSCEKASQAF